MSEFTIQGKTALVTGANRGIGAAFVKALVNAGAQTVYAGVRDMDALRTMQQQYTNTVKPIHLDVTNNDHIATVASTIPQLDLLINNAGIAHGANAISENALEIARLEMETNFFAAVNLTLALLPKLQQSAHAGIINICSIAAISNFPNLAPYSASKAALHSFTQGLRAILGKTSTRIVGVYPGPINTRMAEGWEVEKGEADDVAQQSLAALSNDQNDVFPDAFSQHMIDLFLQHPQELEKAFAATLEQ
ncbi:MAG: SDR family NAD(P)-dependent oxidoreductase [Gammaproteobacteria bacterium]|nr:SDR family NAD(P)-dependent oxidoreductase [Gammaproteobacteria bacterium]